MAGCRAQSAAWLRPFPADPISAWGCRPSI